MSIRKRVILAQAAACVAVIFQAGVAGAVTPSPDPISAQILELGVAVHDTLLSSVAPPIVAAPPPIPDPYADITKERLLPQGVVGDQQHFTPNPEQWDNARTIVEVVRQRGLPVYTAVISVATALQESLLRNLTVAVDYDSLGVFQQRPSQGWGVPEEVTDLRYATGAFLDELLDRAPAYAEIPLWQAAQAAQRSGFPTLYDQWADQAAQMVSDLMRPESEGVTGRVGGNKTAPIGGNEVPMLEGS
ncbi:hypothetical protein [Nocardia callitridis]|uniref:DUF4439 domain-containing protein n=1 Tax=Nocardia callitridis TaxID=648753 RepID=A0ABP9L0T4_9NOCA